MSNIALFSKHISKSKMAKDDVKTVISDLVRFNRMKHKAAVLNGKDTASLEKKKKEGPDLRLKENKELREAAPPSVHMRLKKDFKVNDHFANSANNQSKAALRSVLELRKNHANEIEDTLSQVRDKTKKTRKRMNELLKTKGCLIARSKWAKEERQRLLAADTDRPRKKKRGEPKLKMPKGSVETAEPDGTFKVWSFNPKTGVRKETAVYDNAYLFEVQYLDPKIRRLKSRIRFLENRAEKLEHRLKRAKEHSSVCFGSKALFKKRDTVYKDDHEAWKRRFDKRRYSAMTVSGRSDSVNGNYVFRYDPETRSLTYTSMDGKKVVFPDVLFHYGQKLLDNYVKYQAKHKDSPIAWSVEETGGSFLIKCMLDRDFDARNEKGFPLRLNDYYGDGCVGMDANVDCFALSETDLHGNLLRHKIVRFNLDGLSSGEAEQELSRALDDVFAFCIECKKPLGAEDLADVASKNIYGSKRLNRVLSSFAHTKIRELLLSKSWKYSVAVTFVNPAYTSQIGKIKYMARYGLSIHESAALAIARRAMGLNDRLPKDLRDEVPEAKRRKHHWAQWRSVYKVTKETTVSNLYLKRRDLRICRQLAA